MAVKGPAAHIGAENTAPLGGLGGFAAEIQGDGEGLSVQFTAVGEYLIVRFQRREGTAEEFLCAFCMV